MSNIRVTINWKMTRIQVLANISFIINKISLLANFQIKIIKVKTSFNLTPWTDQTKKRLTLPQNYQKRSKTCTCTKTIQSKWSVSASKTLKLKEFPSCKSTLEMTKILKMKSRVIWRKTTTKWKERKTTMKSMTRRRSTWVKTWDTMSQNL